MLTRRLKMNAATKYSTDDHNAKIKEEIQELEGILDPFVKACNNKLEDNHFHNISIKEEPSSNEENTKDDQQESSFKSAEINDGPFEYVEIKEEVPKREREGKVDCNLSDIKFPSSDRSQNLRRDETNKNQEFCKEILPINLCSSFYGTHTKTPEELSTSPSKKRLKCTASENVHYSFNVDNYNQITTIDMFRLFFSDDILDLIVAGTNVFQEQCCVDNGKKCLPVSRSCIEKFFGILMLMDLNCQPNFSCYWSKSKLYGNELVQKAMSYSKFRNILRFISFTTCLGYDECNKLSKVQPLINILTQSFKIYTPGEEVIFYERKIQVGSSSTSQYGDTSVSQFGDSTPSRYEYRLFKLCSVEGYTWSFKLDIGKEAPLTSRIGTVERILLSLMNGLLYEARILYVSNFYASFDLARKLLAQKTYVCGSLKTQNGDARHNVREAILTSLPDDGGRDSKGKRILQYEIDFEKAKTGASVSDHVLEVNSPLRDCRVWYIKAACELLIGCSVANAFVLYNKYHALHKMSFTKFRESIILSLLNEFSSYTEGRGLENDEEICTPLTPEFRSESNSPVWE